MRLALAEHDIARAVSQSRELDLQVAAVRLQKLEFGGLAHRVADRFKFRSELRQILKEAKFFRNHLAHTFWVSHFGNLRSERGRKIIERDCKLYELQFDRVAELLVSGTGVDAASYTKFVDGTANLEGVFCEWESRLDHADEVMRDSGLYQPAIVGTDRGGLNDDVVDH